MTGLLGALGATVTSAGPFDAFDGLTAGLGALLVAIGFMARTIYALIVNRRGNGGEAELQRRDEHVRLLVQAESWDRRLDHLERAETDNQQRHNENITRFHELRGLLQPLRTQGAELDKRLAIVETRMGGWEASLDRIEHALATMDAKIEKAIAARL